MYLLYRFEKDNKFHLDDNTGQFGMQFDSFDKMRAATVPACELMSDVLKICSVGYASDFCRYCEHNGCNKHPNYKHLYGGL